MAAADASLTDAKPDKILKAIVNTRQDLCNQVDAVAVEVRLFRNDRKKLTGRVTQMEHTLDEIRTAKTWRVKFGPLRPKPGNWRTGPKTLYGDPAVTTSESLGSLREQRAQTR
ncbi:hypothetical protein NDU88_009444 [Pleurodeles waltl]|uniref:Uncharacterized protein n=1 Tax=Pleurodeles waltl TaxID=8319 RepID=A0AAV7RV88_PLEWA|nr:hypothetical protein NDU88_009444 [Pleurodeles waltl]